MHNATVLICTVLMLFVYLFQARKSQTRPDHNDPDRFFLSAGSHSTEEYSGTQIAYALQMATVYPFFLFGFTQMWWLGAWNTIFWAAGIYVFMIVLSRSNSGTLDLIGSSSTLHALMATTHGMPRLRVFASALSIMAFIGLAQFEMVWGTSVLKSILGGSSYLYYLAMMIFSFYLTSVLWIGGQRATIKTSQYQLVLSYIGLHILLGWIFETQGTILLNVDAPLLFPIIFVISSFVIVRRILNFRQDGTPQLMILNLVAVGSLFYVIWQMTKISGFSTIEILSIHTITLPANAYIMLFTMACLPIFFQFVDMTNWQRLSSLSGSKELVLIEAKAGLKQYLIESPLSWLFPIAIGMSAAVFFKAPADADPWIAFMYYITQRPGGTILAIAVVVGVLSIFLSTADSLLSASGYAFAYDILPSSRKLMDSVHRSKSGNHLSEDERILVVNAGKYATSVAIIFSTGIYILVDLVNSDWSARLLGLFLAFYSPMLCFAPSMLMPIIFGKVANKWVCLISMVAPAAAGISIGVYSVFASDPVWQWIAVPVCFCASWTIYLAGFALKSYKI